MRRVLKLVDQFCKHAVGSSSSSRGPLVNMPMLTKARSSKPHGISSMPSISAASDHLSVPGQQNKFADCIIHEGETALYMRAIAPDFRLLDSGAMKLSKRGSVLLSFAHSVGEQKYDWNKKQAQDKGFFLKVIDIRYPFISDHVILQVFALTITELGSLLSLSSNESCEFFHDPLKGNKRAEGKVIKVLQVTPFPNGPGYFFSLKVLDGIKQIEEHFSVPITKSEFTAMQSTFNFILPYIMGWHAFANSININIGE